MALSVLERVQRARTPEDIDALFTSSRSPAAIELIARHARIITNTLVDRVLMTEWVVSRLLSNPNCEAEHVDRIALRVASWLGPASLRPNVEQALLVISHPLFSLEAPGGRAMVELFSRPSLTWPTPLRGSRVRASIALWLLRRDTNHTLTAVEVFGLRMAAVDRVQRTDVRDAVARMADLIATHPAGGLTGWFCYRTHMGETPLNDWLTGPLDRTPAGLIARPTIAQDLDVNRRKFIAALEDLLLACPSDMVNTLFPFYEMHASDTLAEGLQRLAAAPDRALSVTTLQRLLTEHASADVRAAALLLVDRVVTVKQHPDLPAVDRAPARAVDRETLESYARSLGGDLPDGSDPVICTNGARHIAEQFGGIVMGYFAEENPSATVGRDEGGHDFAIVQDRYLVDLWAVDTANMTTQYVFDLEDPVDEQKVRELYGARDRWVPTTALEEVPRRPLPPGLSRARDRRILLP